MSEYQGQETLDGLIEALTKEEHKILRREYERKILPKLRKERNSMNCVNCGTDKEIEFHHIVPLAYGGTNRLSNIVALCRQCHWSIHSNKHRDEVRSKALLGTSGRHRYQYDSDQIAYMIKYLQCQIGTKELIEKANLTNHRIAENRKIKELKKQMGIVAFRNNIDILSKRGHFCENQQIGDVVGYARFTDGRTVYYRIGEDPLIAGEDGFVEGYIDG